MIIQKYDIRSNNSKKLFREFMTCSQLHVTKIKYSKNLQSKVTKTYILDVLIEIAYAVHRHKPFKMIKFHSKANKSFTK